MLRGLILDGGVRGLGLRVLNSKLKIAKREKQKEIKTKRALAFPLAMR
jgi:hypothetical protein